MMLHVENPVWWLMGAALVPLLVHLVAKARPQRRKISSIALLQELLKLQTKRAKPKDWLLLLLRTLVCACVAFAFLLPYWGSDQVGDGKHTLMMVVDDTASMGAADGQQVRMNRAVQVARAALQELAPSDRANMITLSGYPAFLFDKPESGKPLMLRELAKMQSKPAASAGVYDALLAAARQIADLPEDKSGELLIISDFQAHTMQEPVEKLLREYPNMNIRCVTVAQAEAVENTTVESLTLSPAKPLPGQEVTATVKLRHRNGSTGAPSGHVVLNVTLAAGDLRLSQPCELPRDGQAEVQFALTVPQSGKEWLLEARTEADAFPADNTRYLVAPVAAKLECLAIAPDRAQLGFMLRALENIPFLSTLQLPALPENAADYVVWLAPTQDDVPAIRERLAAGACVLVVPDSVKDQACSPLLTDAEATYTAERLTDGSSWKTEIAAPQDAVFGLFDAASLRSLADAGIYARLGGEFGKGLPVGCTVLARYTDGVPAVVRRPVGRGSLIVWNMPVTERDSRWGYSPMCLPVLAEMLLKSRTDAAAEDAVVAGRDCLLLNVPAGVDAASLRLVNAAGEEQVTLLQNSGSGQVLRAEAAATPGVFYWMQGEAVYATAAVNFPIEESALRSYTPASASGRVQTAAQALESAGSAARVELWPWLLGLACLFFVVELLICRERKNERRQIES